MGDTSTPTATRGRSLRTHLAVLVLGVLLPVLAFAALAVWRYAEAEQRRIEEEAADTAREIAAGLDILLAGLVATTRTLADNTSLADGDLARAHRRAVAAGQALGASVVLRDPRSRQVVNSGVPWGEPLPDRSSVADADAAVARTGQPAVSSVFRGIVDRRWNFAVVVPAAVGGEPGHFFSLSVPAARVQAVLDGIATLSPGMVGHVIDGRGAYVARRPGAEAAVGRPAVLRAPDGAVGPVRAAGADAAGTPMRLFSYPSAMSGWRTGVMVPEVALRAPVDQALRITIGLGLLAVLLAVLAAWLGARRIGGATTALAAAGVALERDEPVPAVATPVREVNEVGAALTAAAAERRARERQRQVLVHELNHRVKNTLAVVQSLAAQTLRSSAGLDEARRELNGRLIALAAAHDVLTRSSWEGAELREVLERALAPHGAAGGGRIALAGPPMLLAPRAALALSMAAHELATNAAKYGALSNGAGRVRVEWGAEPPGRLRLTWREVGGPPVAGPPRRRGFGTRLLAQGVAHDLGGTVELAWPPEGLVCTIRAGLPGLQEVAALERLSAGAP